MTLLGIVVGAAHECAAAAAVATALDLRGLEHIMVPSAAFAQRSGRDAPDQGLVLDLSSMTRSSAQCRVEP